LVASGVGVDPELGAEEGSRTGVSLAKNAEPKRVPIQADEYVLARDVLGDLLGDVDDLLGRLAPAGAPVTVRQAVQDARSLVAAARAKAAARARRRRSRGGARGELKP
jgi:hypothetical protein